MNMFKKSLSSLKFVFIDIPSYLIGARQLKSANDYIGDLYKTLKNPICPECNKSALIIKERNNVDEGLCFWSCVNCSFYIVAEINEKKLQQELNKIRISKYNNNIKESDLLKIKNNHKRISRIMYIFSIIPLLGSFYMIANESPILIALDWWCVFFVIYLYAMKRSYRYWQINTGNLFITGSFFKWFKEEKWFV